MLAAGALATVAAAQTLVYDGAPALDPAVSPDGRSLVFASSRGAVGAVHLWLQSSPGSEPRQLTTGAFDNYEPAFSPDGRTIAYRSEARGGGVYLIAAESGKPRLFAPSGRRPRFAPDGRHIAYWAENGTKSGVYVQSTSKRKAVPLFGNLPSAHHPVWSPDGKQVLFAGCRDASAAGCDWWVGAADGSAPAATGASKFFQQLRLEGLPAPELWLTNNRIVFTARKGEETRLWVLSLRPSDWQATGPAARLTSGAKDERSPSATADGRIVYASRDLNVDVWSLPLRADAGAVTGMLQRITSHPDVDQRPSLSLDGTHVAWETSRGGNFEVWVKDLVSGAEKGLTNGPLREHMPAIAPDGKRLVYDTHDGEKVTVLESAFDGGAPLKIHEENTGQGSFQWTRGGEVLYFHREPPGTVGLLNLATKKRTVLLRHPKWNLSIADARISPDGRWIVFPVPYAPHRSRIAIAPVSGAVIDQESSWQYLIPDTFNSAQPEWSPSGEWLYFLSDQNGKQAVWAMKMSREGKPASSPTLILDLPGPGLSFAEMRPRDIGLSVATDKLALGVTQYGGTIWSLKP